MMEQGIRGAGDGGERILGVLVVLMMLEEELDD